MLGSNIHIYLYHPDIPFSKIEYIQSGLLVGLHVEQV